MPTKSQPRRKAGRPAKVDRDDLLEAAETLFADAGFEGTSTREIARAAGCNVALISYYFGSKEGLYDALLRRLLERVESSYATEKLEPDFTGQFSSESQALFCAAVYRWASVVIANPRMQRILSRELMEGAQAFTAALKHSDWGFHGALMKRIRKLIRDGELVKGASVSLLALEIISPIIYSCLATPVLKKVYNVRSLDDRYARELCVHLTQSLFQAWGPR